MANLNDTTVSGNLKISCRAFLSHPLAIAKGGTGNGEFNSDALMKVSSDGSKWEGINKDSNSAYPITVSTSHIADYTGKCIGIKDSYGGATINFDYNSIYNETVQVLGYNSINSYVTLYPVSATILSGENSLKWDGYVFTFQGFIKYEAYISVC